MYGIGVTAGQKGDGVDQLNSVLQPITDHLGPYAPRIVGALAILAAAWVIAILVRATVLRAAARARIEQRLQSEGLSGLLANIAYWLVWLFAMPALLGTLELEALLTPFNAMMSRIMTFVPSFMGAAVVFGVGFLVARILRQLVTGVLKAAGSERLAVRIGLASALGENSLAGLVGSIVFAFVMLPTLTAGLQTLGLDAIAKPVGHLLDSVFDAIPKLISAGLIVAIGAVLGRMLAGVVTALLAGVGVNDLPGHLGMSDQFRIAGRDLSEFAGSIVMVAAVFLATTQACEVLGFAVLTDAVTALGAALTRLVVALVIIGVGLWLGTLAQRAVISGTMANARVLSQIVRGMILFFTAALALRQSGLPADIVTIAFGSVVGALAIGVAVATGVGGRHVAARLLEEAAASFRHQKDKAGAGGD